MGGAADDEAMQFLYMTVCNYSHPLYSPPKVAVGNRFITTLTKEFMLARTRVTNSERAEIFPACILRKERGCSGTAAIKRRILRRLEMWDEGKYAELAEDVARAARNLMGKTPMPDDDNGIARRYHSLVMDGRLQAAVRYATNRSGGGVLARVTSTRNPACPSSRCLGISTRR